MKRTLTIIAALLLTGTLMAQQGSFFATGNLGFNSRSETVLGVDVPASTDFGIGLEGHYMLTDNIAVGLGIGYDFEKGYIGTAPISDAKLYRTSSYFNIKPSIIYFHGLTERLSYAPELALDLGFGNKKVDITGNSSTTTSQNYFGLIINPINFNYNVSDNIAFVFGFGAITWKYDNYGDKNSRSRFGINLNQSYNIGLRYFF